MRAIPTKLPTTTPAISPPEKLLLGPGGAVELVALWVEVDVDDDMVGDVEFTEDVVDGAAAASSEASNVSVGFPGFAEESELKV